VITPASWAEVAIAPFLLVSASMLYGLQIAVLYADAGSYTYRLVAFVRALGIIPGIDDNLRRLGKRFLATRFFLDQWRRWRAPRSAVERYFAFLKRYYGLKYFQVQGWEAVWRYALLVNAAMLAVALIADRMNQPNLMTRRAHVLAFVPNCSGVMQGSRNTTLT
jgi:hypothetical protein